MFEGQGVVGLPVPCVFEREGVVGLPVPSVFEREGVVVGLHIFYVCT